MGIPLYGELPRRSGLMPLITSTPNRLSLGGYVIFAVRLVLLTCVVAAVTIVSIGLLRLAPPGMRGLLGAGFGVTAVLLPIRFFRSTAFERSFRPALAGMLRSVRYLALYVLVVAMILTFLLSGPVILG